MKTRYVKQYKSFLRLIPFLLLAFPACEPVALYEKSVVIPGHNWKSSFRPEFSFTISDTTRPYQLYFIIRHSDRYRFNNIFVNLYAKGPGQDTAQAVRYDIRLGTDDKGWLGAGMDDIYEHRELLTPRGQEFFFKKPGLYRFTLEQIMREDPLEEVYNTGLRIEKK